MRGGRIVESRSLTGPLSGRVKVRAMVAPPQQHLAERVAAALASFPDVELLHCDGDGAAFALRDQPAERTALLQALLQAGLPVVSFADDHENLHESYLHTLQAHAPDLATKSNNEP